jgi:hypothetical protein
MIVTDGESREQYKDIDVLKLVGRTMILGSEKMIQPNRETV